MLYVGDLPIEGAMAGAAVLYRLLEDYPQGRLRIALSNLAVGTGYLGAPRLAGVGYDEFFLAPKRPLYTRLGRWYRWCVLALAGWTARRVRHIAREFNAEAVLSTGVGYSWRLAAALARETELPFYLVSHDDWQVNLDVPRPVQGLTERWFATAFRQAAARFVVSPYMASVYELRYGAPAVVLYPSRVKGAPAFATPPERVRARPSNFVYAGSVYPRYAELLVHCARNLSVLGCTLTVYSPLTDSEILATGLNLPNVNHRPVLSTHEVTVRLRDEADVLLVPMSFHADDRANIEVAFPSKLADYTATGLPILVWAPPYSSVVGWARQYTTAAAVVDEQSDEALQGTLRRLLADPEYRYALGAGALDVGNRLFTHEAVARTFFDGLQ